MTDTTETSFATPVDDAHASTKDLVFDALARADIQTVTVGFDGYGDSGQIEDIKASGPAGQDIPLPANRTLQLAAADPAAETTLHDAIEILVFDYLEETHWGWENGEGAYGTFVFNVPGRTITLEHNERFIEVETFNHSF